MLKKNYDNDHNNTKWNYLQCNFYMKNPKKMDNVFYNN